MLNLGRLEVLCAVARDGSFSAAAESLAYTQSAVSQSIARLEAETGTQLVQRGRRGVTLTDTGARLLGHAEAILRAVRAAEDDLARSTGGERTRLRVGSFPSGGAALMPLAVARFRRAHPDVALTLTEGEPEEIIMRLRGGELDLGLIFDFPPAAHTAAGRPRAPAGLRGVPLFEDPLDVALAPGHPLATASTIILDDLREESWVQPSGRSPCARHVVELCRAAGFTPDVAFESDDYDTVQGLVAAGIGVALVPRLAIAPDQRSIVVRRLSPRSPVRRVLVASPAGAPPSAAARAMARVLSELAARRRGRADPDRPGGPGSGL